MKKLYYVTAPKKEEKYTFSIKAIKPLHDVCSSRSAVYSKKDKAVKKAEQRLKKELKQY